MKIIGREALARRTTAILKSRLLALAAMGCAAGPALAGATIKGPTEDSFITLGAGLRASFTSAEDGAPNGSSRSKDFEVDSVRLFTGGQVIKGIKGTFNVERANTPGNDRVRVLDAYAQFEFLDEFNVWFGRMLPPSDRANLAGPYYANAWGYPGIASQYPAVFAGRDDGVTLWGKPMGGKLVYSAGLFEGKNRAAGLSNDSAKLLVAGRIAYAILDPEPAPAYYVGNTYYGSNDIATIGFAFMHQKDGVGTALAKGDYTAWNVDALLEKKLGAGGALTLEGAYYDYDTDGVVDASPAVCGSTDNCGGATQGKSWLGTLALLVPGKVGVGQFQPFVRYQQFKPDSGFGHKKTQADFGVNYVIAGPNAYVSLMYSNVKNDDPALDDRRKDAVIAGVQLMY